MTFKTRFTLAIFGLVISLAACTAPSKKNPEPSADIASNKGPVEAFLQGCKTELDSYCRNVTPGQTRLLACIYAHEDKLSGRCEYALYDAAAQLEQAVAAFSYAVAECDDDLEKYCANVEAGEGRLLACLDRNGKKVSRRCKQALNDTGLKQ